jgi:hypothetical protein
VRGCGLGGGGLGGPRVRSQQPFVRCWQELQHHTPQQPPTGQPSTRSDAQGDGAQRRDKKRHARPTSRNAHMPLQPTSTQCTAHTCPHTYASHRPELSSRGTPSGSGVKPGDGWAQLARRRSSGTTTATRRRSTTSNTQHTHHQQISPTTTAPAVLTTPPPEPPPPPQTTSRWQQPPPPRRTGKQRRQCSDAAASAHGCGCHNHLQSPPPYPPLEVRTCRYMCAAAAAAAAGAAEVAAEAAAAAAEAAQAARVHAAKL